MWTVVPSQCPTCRKGLKIKNELKMNYFPKIFLSSSTSFDIIRYYFDVLLSVTFREPFTVPALYHTVQNVDILSISINEYGNRSQSHDYFNSLASIMGTKVYCTRQYGYWQFYKVSYHIYWTVPSRKHDSSGPQ